MARVNKYRYIKVIQRYCNTYGWEDMSEYETFQEKVQARTDLKEYRIYEPGVSYRIISRRELKRHEGK